MIEQTLLTEDPASLQVFEGKGTVRDFEGWQRQDWVFEPGVYAAQIRFGRVNQQYGEAGNRFAGEIHLITEQKERALGNVCLNNPREGEQWKV